MAVILDGHTLAVQIGNDLQILRASPLRGSPHPAIGCISVPQDKTRLKPATQADFKAFRVQWHPDYAS